MKIFEWNFQQTFHIKFHEKWIQNGWAWSLFDTYHNHFSKTLLFRKWPLKPNKSWKFKIFFCIIGNHFIGLFNGILHVLIFWVVAEKQKDFDWGYILIWNRLYLCGQLLIGIQKLRVTIITTYKLLCVFVFEYVIYSSIAYSKRLRQGRTVHIF